MRRQAVLFWTMGIATAALAAAPTNLAQLLHTVRRELPFSSVPDADASLRQLVAHASVFENVSCVGRASGTECDALRLAAERIRKELPSLCKTSSDSEEAPCSVTEAQRTRLMTGRKILQDLELQATDATVRRDATYLLGLAAVALGDPNEAERRFQARGDEALPPGERALALEFRGDFAFYDSRFADAEALYARATDAWGDDRYARWRRAVSLTNLGKFSDALREINAAAAVKAPLGAYPPSTTLLRAAIPALLAEPSVPTTESFTARLDDASARWVFETLLTQFGKLKQPSWIEQIGRLLLKRDPLHPDNPRYEIAVATARLASQDAAASASYLVERLPLYTPGSSWQEKNGEPRVRYKAALAMFELELRRFSVNAHAEAQKTQDRTRYEAARQLYESYLRYFTGAKDESEVRFYLADVLYKLGDFAAAALQFETTYENADAPEARRADALVGAIKSLDEILPDRSRSTIEKTKTAKKAGGRPAAQAPEPTPPSEVEAKFLRLVDVMTAKYPKHPEVTEVAYAGAYIRYRHMDFFESRKRLWTILTRYPETPSAEDAAFLFLDIVNKDGNYDELSATAERILSLPAFLNDPPARLSVLDVLRRTELQRAAALEKNGQHREAAERYREYVATYCSQDETLCESALVNAAAAYDKLGTALPAIEVREDMLRRLPHGKFRKDALLALGKNYESLGYLAKASKAYLGLAQEFPKDEQAPLALRMAGTYALGSGQVEKAEALFLNALQQYPDETLLDYAELALLYRSVGATERHFQILGELRKTRANHPDDFVRLSMSYVRLGRMNGVDTAAVEAEIALAQKHATKEMAADPELLEIFAENALYRMEPKVAEFLALPIAPEPERMQASVQKIIERTKALESEYQKIAAMRSGPATLGALYATALLYRHAAETIRSAPVPPDLTAEQRRIYEENVDRSLLTPLREAARTLVGQCLDGTKELRFASHWPLRCYALGSELSPERYPPVKTAYVPPLRLAEVPDENDGDRWIRKSRQWAYPYGTLAMFDTLAPLFEESAQGPPLEAEPPSLRAAQAWLAPVPGDLRALQTVRRAALAKELTPPGGAAVLPMSALRQLAFAEPKRALPLILRALDTYKKQTSVKNLLAIAYANTGNWPAARAVLLSAAGSGPVDAAIWNNLGVAAFALGDTRGAQAFWDKSVEVGSQSEAHANLGSLYLRDRSALAAKRHLESAEGDFGKDVSIAASIQVARLQAGEMSALPKLEALAFGNVADGFALGNAVWGILDGVNDESRARALVARWKGTKGRPENTISATANAYAAMTAAERETARRSNALAMIPVAAPEGETRSLANEGPDSMARPKLGRKPKKPAPLSGKRSSKR